MFKKKSTRKKVRDIMLNEKEEELERHRIVSEYLKYRIEEENETNRRETLTQMQTMMDELERQIKFIKSL